MLRSLLLDARRAWDVLGYIPSHIALRLQQWGVNVNTLEENWVKA